MKRATAYLRVTEKGARYAFRPNEMPVIIGVAMVQPDDGKEYRPCLLVGYDDQADYVPLSDVQDGYYEVVMVSKRRAGSPAAQGW